MNRNTITIIAAVTLAGCAVNKQTLNQYGDTQLDGNVLKSLTITHDEPANLGKLPFCVASTVTNESVMVSDSAGSFVGAYTGKYYQAHNSKETGGGSVMQFVSQDGSEVVARGTTRYWAAMIERAVRFTVSIKDDGVSRTYRFTGVEVAQINSGSWPNSGFSRAAMNPGTGGGHALKNMRQIADDIDTCLR